MFGGSSGDRILRRITGRRSFPHLYKRNVEILVGNEAEEGTVPFHDNFKGTA